MRSIRQSYSMYEIRGEHSGEKIADGWGQREGSMMQMKSSDEWHDWNKEEDMRMRACTGSYNSLSSDDDGSHRKDFLQTEAFQYTTLPRSLTIQRKLRKPDLATKSIKQFSPQIRNTKYGRKHSLFKIDENHYEEEEEYREPVRRTI